MASYRLYYPVYFNDNPLCYDFRNNYVYQKWFRLTATYPNQISGIYYNDRLISSVYYNDKLIAQRNLMTGATYEIYYNASAVTEYGSVAGKWNFELQNFRSERNEVVEYVNLRNITFNYHTIDASKNVNNYSQTGISVLNKYVGAAFKLYLDSINIEIAYKLVGEAEASKTITADINKHCDVKLGWYDGSYFAKGEGTIYTDNIVF